MSTKYKHIANEILSLPEEENRKRQRELLDETERQHKSFLETFPNGQCYLCAKELSYFDKYNPCLHWLLRENTKIKKTHIIRLLNKVDLGQVISYLRWIATLEQRMKSINDLKEECGEKVYYQTTIRYKNLKWTIFINHNDLIGHQGRNANFPHYHFEFRIINEKYNTDEFMNFSDTHIPLNDYDIFNLQVMRGEHPDIKYYHAFGESYEDMTNFFTPDQIVENMSHTDDESKATFHNQVFIEAKPGTTINGSVLADLMKERDRTGKPISSLAKKIPNASVKVIVSPADDMVDLRHSKSSRGNKK